MRQIKPFSAKLGSEIIFQICSDESVGVELGGRYVALSPEELRIFLVELETGYRASAE